MTRIICITTILMLLTIVSTGHAAMRVALVIGNAAYKDAPLRNPLNDAKDMASVLKSLGFSVTFLKDANRERMETAIDNFGRKLTESDIGLFYFAGHGAEIKGNNYLFPINAKVNNEADVRYRTVDAGYVLAEMEASGAKTNIVILDACRNNPFTRKFRSGSRGLAMMEAPIGSLIAFATSPGKLAEDGTGRNGIYTKHLLEHLNTPGLTLRDVMLKTRIGVANETRRRQIPWDASSLMAEVYLAGGAPSMGTASAPSFEAVPHPAPSAPPTWLEPTTGIEFVWIPGGCFQMGSNYGEQDERPVREICVDGIWMGKYEITNAQFRRFKPDHDSWKYKDYSLNGDSQPATVAWITAREYAEWMSSKGSDTYRLPTEAEWEYAARAGTETARPWGNDDEFACSYENVKDASYCRAFSFNPPCFQCDDGYVVTAPVGSFMPNNFGLYDMLGNVGEHCEDTYDKTAYSHHSRENPLNSGKIILGSNRGGSWTDGPADIRSANRGMLYHSIVTNRLGFRLIRKE